MPEPGLPWELAGIGDEAAPDLAGQLAAVRGLGGLELRSVGGTALADLPPGELRGVLRAVRAAGVRVVCLDSRIGGHVRPVTGPLEAELAELDVLARCCAELDCRFVRVMSWPNDGPPNDGPRSDGPRSDGPRSDGPRSDGPTGGGPTDKALSGAAWRAAVLERMRRLAGVAERHGITLLHENCAGWVGGRADRALELLATVDSPALRLLFDTGNGVEHGYAGPALLAELLPWVAHVHVKDGVRGPDGTRWVLPGDGGAGVVECLRLLHRHGYAGVLSLEPHLATRPHEDRWTGTATGFAAAAERLAALSRALSAAAPAAAR